LAAIDGTLSADGSSDVKIPTARDGGGLHPVARASAALIFGLFLVCGLFAHPRTRSVLLARLKAAAGSVGREGGPAIEVRSTAALGPGQRVVVLDVEGARLLVGVSPGRMDVLHAWTGAPTPAEQLEAGDPIPTVVEATVAHAEPQEESELLPADQSAVVTPSATQLLAAWQRGPQTVAPAPPSRVEQDEAAQIPWWLEGATDDEKARLDEVADPGSSDGPDDAAEETPAVESVLAQLRSARARETLSETLPERGSNITALGRVSGDDTASRPPPAAITVCRARC
jgi:flagellar biogenesis protein FliO